MPASVIVAGARTPIRKLSGSLARLTAVDLGAAELVAKEQIDDRRAGTPPRYGWCVAH